MLLGLICTILTATFSLSSNNSVNAEGDIPTYSTYTYERSTTTGQIGQMTAGNTTHLNLTGWDGCKIRSVVLHMRSNSKSGAGSLQMTIGDDKVWRIDNQSFASEEWGGFFTTEWIDVCKQIDVQVGNYEKIDICISATENSLYVNRYTIEYEQAPEACYQIVFNTGLDIAPNAIIQSEIGEAVVLPEWRDTAQWYFLGWSEMEVLDSMMVPELWIAGSEYIPQGNTYLWAVYSDVKEVAAIEEYSSGRYVLAMCDAATKYYSNTGMAMCGSIIDSEVPLVAVNMQQNATGRYCLMSKIEDDMIYELEFEDSTLSITHAISEKPIGYLDTRLDHIEKKWQYKVLKDGSLVIYLTDIIPTNTYALRFSVSTNYDERPLVAKVQRMDVVNWESDGMWLFPIMYPYYTSWPFGKKEIPKDEDIETISSILSEGIYVMHFGGYVLYVKDQRKYLLPQEIIR